MVEEEAPEELDLDGGLRIADRPFGGRGDLRRGPERTASGGVGEGAGGRREIGAGVVCGYSAAVIGRDDRAKLGFCAG